MPPKGKQALHKQLALSEAHTNDSSAPRTDAQSESGPRGRSNEAVSTITHPPHGREDQRPGSARPAPSRWREYSPDSARAGSQPLPSQYRRDAPVVRGRSDDRPESPVSDGVSGRSRTYRSLGSDGISERNLSLGSQRSTSRGSHSPMDDLVDDMANMVAEAFEFPSTKSDIDIDMDIDQPCPELDPEVASKWYNRPPEVQIDVLSRQRAGYLLWHTNTVSPLKHVIRVNDVVLARRVIDRKKAEFTAAIAGFDYSQCSFFDAIHHWSSHKGWPTFWGRHTTDDFALHYIGTCGGNYFVDAPLFGSFLRKMQHDHSVNVEMLTDKHSESRAELIQLAVKLGLPPHLKVDSFERPAHAQMSQLGPRVDFDLLRAENDLIEERSSTRHLTQLCTRYDGITAAIDENAFLAMFDLPRLPWTGHEDLPRGLDNQDRESGHFRPRIAYCAFEHHLPRIMETFQEALRLEANGEDMRAIQKASILDNVFIR